MRGTQLFPRQQLQPRLPPCFSSMVIAAPFQRRSRNEAVASSAFAPPAVPLRTSALPVASTTPTSPHISIHNAPLAGMGRQSLLKPSHYALLHWPWRRQLLQIPRNLSVFPQLWGMGSRQHVEFARILTSCVHLSAQVAGLEKELLLIRSSSTATERLVRGLESYADRAFRRALFFANEAASQALSSMHTEFKPIPETIVAGNSIVQISLWSKTSERTFFDFRILVSAFTRRPGIRCAVLPSTSFVLKFSTPRAYCFRVEFGTFSDICQALDVAANSRG